jgi:hypothetical protein
MKKIPCILSILLLVSCINSIKNITSTKTIIKDTVSTTELPKIKIDTLITTSKPFKINNILFYWKKNIVTYDPAFITLYNYETGTRLIELNLNEEDSNIDESSSAFFNEFNKIHFQDLNFDGFKDFNYYSRAPHMEMNSLTNIALFNNDTKSFDYSEEIEAIYINEIDSINRKLVTSSFDLEYEYKKNHYFDKSGKIKYSEIITKWDSIVNDTTEIHKNLYQKLINGKVVKTKEYITTK